jgi:phosphodiesterase/alkaline phosphatase D-like protein
MRRVAFAAALAVLGVAVVVAEAASPSFPHGVAAGEVTSTSAILWTRAPTAGRVEAQLSSRGKLLLRRSLQVSPARDLIAQVRITGLRPGTRYHYRFRHGSRVSERGAFETAPSPTAASMVRFALSGDADATRTADGQPGFNRFEVYARMAAERNDFNVNLGDTIYSDSSVGGRPPALTVEEKRAKYRLALALPALRRLRASGALYSHWDDHEFVNDFSRPEHGDAIYGAGVKAFRDYSPVAYSGALGLYRTVRWGRNLELFFLDERSFRSAKADDACDGDLAPTLPPAVREAFGTLAPPLKRPVAPACLAALSDPGRTMLGARQYAAFTSAIAASTATWKVVVNEVPMQQYYALPYDRWEGYAAERERLLRFLQSSVRNVVFLTTDAHASFVNEIRSHTLDQAPESTGIWEVVTGPVATSTFAGQIDSFLGTQGAAAALGAVFLKPAPPTGMGMRCAVLDAFAYAQVTVTARTLTVALRDDRGRPLREATGAECPRLVLRAR